jgi:hypothetical protein
MHKTRKHMYTNLHCFTAYYLTAGGRVSFTSLMGGHVWRNIYYRMCRQTQWAISVCADRHNGR